MEIVLIKSYTDKPWRSPETYDLIEDSLKEKWPVTATDTKSPQVLFELCKSLERGNRGEVFVFNIAEYLDEAKKEFFIPALLDGWKVSHLGSSLETVRIGLDKARTKQTLIEHQVPTPRYFAARKIDSGFEDQAKRIGFPLIVKPIGEGGHIGINETSIVYDAESLKRTISHILDTYDQAALIEEYIHGDGMREFSVGIIDGDHPISTPIEIDYDAMAVSTPILSYDAAQNDLERTKLVTDQNLRSEIVELARKTFEAVGAQDYSRVDLRMDRSGIYVLEINIMPGLGPHSFLPAAAKEIHGLDYPELVQKLATVSIRRQGVDAAKG